jgi:hypothetical protein
MRKAGVTSSSKAQSAFANASVADIFGAFESGPSMTMVDKTVDSLTINCFKLLDKKDSTTRIKALQDFISGIMPSKEVEEIDRILPHYLHYYSRGCVLDPDWKCRVLYQNAMRVICESLGKRTESSLKVMIPWCLLSMNELSHREVGLSAARVMDALFPSDDKKTKVVSHFADAILELIQTNLEADPEALDRQFRACGSDSSDASFESSERYERVIAASIRTLQYLGSKCDPTILPRLMALNAFRFVDASFNESIQKAAITFTNWMLEHHADVMVPEIPKLASHLSNLLKPDLVEAWSLLQYLSQRQAKIETSPLISLLKSTDVRQYSVPMVKALRDLVKTHQSVSKVLFEKLQEGMVLDGRIRSKYHPILEAIIACLMEVDSDKIVEEILVACRSDFKLRKFSIKNVSGKTVHVDPDIIGPGAYHVLRVSGCLDSPSPTIWDLESIPIEEIRLFIESVSSDYELENLASNILSLAPDSSREICQDELVVLDKLMKFVTNIHKVRKHIGFSNFVSLALHSESDWMNRVKADHSMISPDTLDDATFVRAINFDRAAQTIAGRVLDNGLLAIGSPEYSDLIKNISFSEDLEDIISLLVEKRKESGVSAYIDDDLAVHVFETYLSEWTSPPVMDLIPSSPNLRTRFAHAFGRLCFLTDNWIPDDEEENPEDLMNKLMPQLFVSVEDIEPVIREAVTCSTKSKRILKCYDDPPVMDLLLQLAPELMVTLSISLLRVWNAKEDKRKIGSYFFQFSENPEMAIPLVDLMPYDFAFGWIVRALLERNNRKDTESDEGFVERRMQEVSLWNLFLIRFVVDNSRLGEDFTLKLVKRIETLRTSSKDESEILFMNAVLCSLNAAQLVAEQTLAYPTMSDDEEIDLRRAKEEAFCICLLARDNFDSVDTSQLRFIDVKAVADVVLRTGHCEQAYNLYHDMELPLMRVEYEVIKFLTHEGSIGWALKIFDRAKYLDWGLECIHRFAFVDLLSHPELVARIRKQNATTERAVTMRVFLWNMILGKFMEIKAETFCFFFEYVDEALTAQNMPNATELAGMIKDEFWLLALSLFEGIQNAERNNADSEALYLGSWANRLLPLILKAAPPGDIHEWASANRNVASEKVLTDLGISGNLIQDEISSTNKYKKDKLRTQFSLSSKMLVCNYSSHEGEIQAELKVRFPDCWPLRLGVVEVSPVVGLSKAKNARLQMSIQSVFRLNGVQNAIQIWIENIEGFLKDVEECYICYSVTYHHGTKGTGTGTGTGGSIPNKQCRTCNYKFHSECLLKYFRTSGKTICCLCQNPF